MLVLVVPAIGLLIATVVPTLVVLWRYRANSPSLPSPVGPVIVVVLTLLALCTGQLVLGLFPIVLACMASMCQSGGASKRFASWCVVTTAVAMNLCIAGRWSNFAWGLNAELRKHPVISLADRLDYESDVRTITEFGQIRNNGFHRVNIDEQKLDVPLAENANAQLIIQFEKRFAEAGIRDNADRRRRMLENLLMAHHDTTYQFAQEMGLGVGRMRVFPYREWRLDLPDTAPISMPGNDLVVSKPIEEEGSPSSIGMDFQPWHEENLINFASPTTLGLVEWDWDSSRADLSQVVGFKPHAFRSKPESPIRSGSDNPWRIDSLLLISLLKHRPPAVYLTNNLPDMNALAEVPTRPLDEFESSSLEQLTQGEELVVHGGQTQIRMFGALRAAVQCLECHQVARGTMLGAFSYRLVRDESNATEAPESAP